MSPLDEAFSIVRRALESADVRYAIGGSWASAAYGSARLTKTVDSVWDTGNVLRNGSASAVLEFVISGLNHRRPRMTAATIDPAILQNSRLC